MGQSFELFLRFIVYLVSKSIHVTDEKNIFGMTITKK